MPKAMSAIQEQLRLPENARSANHLRLKVPVDQDVLLVNTVQFEKCAKLDLCLRHAAIENHCSNEAVYSYHPDLLCFCACGITGCKLVCL